MASIFDSDSESSTESDHAINHQVPKSQILRIASLDLDSIFDSESSSESGDIDTESSSESNSEIKL
jgi:hypothetical protein